jgi:electron transport complex protein RnfD
MLSELRVSTAPHIGQPLSTRRVMLDVIIGLAPAMIAAGVFFHSRAVVLIATCVVTEWICNLLRRRPNPRESLGDLSAVVTGIILALSLPPALPAWAAVIGSAFAIGIGKMVFGGLGSNIFNPAMIGRTFLTACFGILMTTWTVPATVDPNMPVVRQSTGIDARTQATPLAWSKQAWKARASEGPQKQQYVDNVNRYLPRSFLGEKGGCLGETSILALLVGGAYLLIRKTITWHIPLAVLVAASAFSGLIYLTNPTAAVAPWGHLCSGGLLLCAFFIATDPVTAPLTAKGMWIFGAGVGLLTILIRVYGEYPEGIMYAVLLMNCVTPLIDRFCTLVPAGGKPHV